MKKRGARQGVKKYPIGHWSHSSLVTLLRNPLVWYKRYVEQVHDMPSTAASVIGRAGHKALEHFYLQVSEAQMNAEHSSGRANAGGKLASKAYSDAPVEVATRLGLEYMRSVSDFELDFGSIVTKKGKREKRQAMERDYLQAIGFYLAKPPRHKVLGVEVSGFAKVKGIPLPLKAISDLVVESPGNTGAVDIVDHKFVATFSKRGNEKTLFVLQALFNYYTVLEAFGRPVRRFVVFECKKTKNADGSPQLRRHTLDYASLGEEFIVFNRLLRDASAEIKRPRHYLPNPSDLFDGDHSFLLYRLGLAE